MNEVVDEMVAMQEFYSAKYLEDAKINHTERVEQVMENSTVFREWRAGTSNEIEMYVYVHEYFLRLCKYFEGLEKVESGVLFSKSFVSACIEEVIEKAIKLEIIDRNAPARSGIHNATRTAIQHLYDSVYGEMSIGGVLDMRTADRTGRPAVRTAALRQQKGRMRPED